MELNIAEYHTTWVSTCNNNFYPVIWIRVVYLRLWSSEFISRPLICPLVISCCLTALQLSPALGRGCGEEDCPVARGKMWMFCSVLLCFWGRAAKPNTHDKLSPLRLIRALCAAHVIFLTFLLVKSFWPFSPLPSVLILFLVFQR